MNLKVGIGTFLMIIFGLGCSDNSDTSSSDTSLNETTMGERGEETALGPKEIRGTPTFIKGKVSGLKAGSKVFFDRKTTDAIEVLDDQAIQENGSFEIKVGIQESGIYRLRLGVNGIYLILGGGEDLDIEINIGEDQKLKNYVLKGSPVNEELAKWSLKKPNQEEIMAYLETAPKENALVNLYLVERLEMSKKNMKWYRKVRDQLTEQYPNSMYARNFNSKVLQIESKLNQQTIGIGELAPEIHLPNPDGKKIALSTLRGKVVLLDFWSSWCGPCRRENPNVVRMYKKYKDKGFTVYSVSLDGLDNRKLGMLQNRYRDNPQELQKQVDIAEKTERQKWIAAIKQDQLLWENHVSDLKGWGSAPAQLYGVKSIPRTFLLDKDGKIIAMNLRGAALEERLKELFG